MISITTANPGPQFEARARVGYDFTTRNPQGELMLSGPVNEQLGIRLAIWGQDMLGGYVRNTAPAGTYTTTDAATFTPTTHDVPAPRNRDLPGQSTVLGRLTALYRPAEAITVSVKASAERDQQGLRDHELLEIAQHANSQTSRQLTWLNTRMKTAAPQALIVAP